jgi:hypothetical protein
VWYIADEDGAKGVQWVENRVSSSRAVLLRLLLSLIDFADDRLNTFLDQSSRVSQAKSVAEGDEEKEGDEDEEEENKSEQDEKEEDQEEEEGSEEGKEEGGKEKKLDEDKRDGDQDEPNLGQSNSESIGDHPPSNEVSKRSARLAARHKRTLTWNDDEEKKDFRRHIELKECQRRGVLLLTAKSLKSFKRLPFQDLTNTPRQNSRNELCS